MNSRKKSPEERNQELIDRLDRFQVVIQRRDPWLAGRIRSIVQDLLETGLSLADTSESGLTRIHRVGPKVAGYLSRLLRGGSVEALAEEIPLRGRPSRTSGGP